MDIKFIFEKDKEDWGTTIMRGFDIAKKLNIDVIEINNLINPENLRIVSLKMSDYSNLLKISDKNEIVIDMVDFKLESQLQIFKNFSFGIFTSDEQKEKYKNYFKNPEKCVTIYHHWDQRFKNIKIEEMESLKICYFGEKKKCHLFNEFTDIEYNHIDGKNFKDNIQKYKYYNCHYIMKPENHEKLIQPMTKLSTAAILNCPVIVQKANQYVELLGDRYPYYVNDNKSESIRECIDLIKKTYRQKEWKISLDIMKEVKKRTSFNQIINEYKVKILTNR